MAGPDRDALELVIRVDAAEELAALEQALLRARATELAEVRRRDTRLLTGLATRRRVT